MLSPLASFPHQGAASERLGILFSSSSFEFYFIHIHFQWFICRTLITTFFSPQKDQTKIIFIVILLGISASLDDFYFYIFYNVYLFLRERERVHTGEGQREKETQNPKQAPGSQLSAQNPAWSSNP